MDEVEGEKKKWFCLKCGHVFESDREAPHCPACHRRKVAPVELLKSAFENYKDVLYDNGLPVQDIDDFDPEKNESDRLIQELLEDEEEEPEVEPEPKPEFKQKVKQVKEKVSGVSVPAVPLRLLGFVLLIGLIYFAWKEGIIQKFLPKSKSSEPLTEDPLLEKVRRNLNRTPV